MTASPEATAPDETAQEARPAAPALGLRMVGPSGAVCVDGACSIDPIARPAQEGDSDAR